MDIKYKFQIGDHVRSCGEFAHAKFSGIIQAYSKNSSNRPCYAVVPDDHGWLKSHDSELYPRFNGIPSWFEGFLELIEPVNPIVSYAECDDML